MTKNVLREGSVSMTFDAEIAKKIGIDEAIMLNHICFWCSLNKKNNSQQHLHDGAYWTYFSRRELTEFFGFWSESQVRRILDRLVRYEHLKKGRFNRKGYDKTSWYTPSPRMTIFYAENSQPEVGIDHPW